MNRVLLLALALAFTGAAQAAGDAAAGQSKAAVCAACHGADGNSAVPQWPKLAGQHADYIANQVRMVRDGDRQIVEMVGIVAGLSDQDIDDISAYYASQTIKPGSADEAKVALGEKIYRAGNAESGVPACMACHGPTGQGNPASGYPAVAGQHDAYLSNRLQKYRNGQVNGAEDPYSPQMVTVAKELTDEEISAVASYMQGLHSAK
ncbi:MAG: cytochrome c4 [Xanthomonadales bacterium]|jgi:cytochrome c553|nr:cytochrome c4 [Xanthomonadales bacterium]